MISLVKLNEHANGRTQRDLKHSPAKLSPPLSTNNNSVSNSACNSSNAPIFADISSLIAACGQPPVSIARIRSAGKASFRIRNSWSSRVKMSFVTAAIAGLAHTWPFGMFEMDSMNVCSI